jgi:hypothetical protein
MCENKLSQSTRVTVVCDEGEGRQAWSIKQWMEQTETETAAALTKVQTFPGMFERGQAFLARRRYQDRGLRVPDGPGRRRSGLRIRTRGGLENWPDHRQSTRTLSVSAAVIGSLISCTPPRASSCQRSLQPQRVDAMCLGLGVLSFDLTSVFFVLPRGSHTRMEGAGCHVTPGKP